MSKARDPKVDPQRGDVLRHGKFTLRVLEVDGWVHYEQTERGGKGLHAFPLQGIVPVRKWPQMAAEFEEGK